MSQRTRVGLLERRLLRRMRRAAREEIKSAVGVVRKRQLERNRVERIERMAQQVEDLNHRFNDLRGEFVAIRRRYGDKEPKA